LRGSEPNRRFSKLCNVLAKKRGRQEPGPGEKGGTAKKVGQKAVLERINSVNRTEGWKKADRECYGGLAEKKLVDDLAAT